MTFRALTLAEKEVHQWRGDYTLPGIAARVSDGGGRVCGFWVGDTLEWGSDDRVHIFVKGKNGQTSFSTSMTAAEARDLAESLVAMAAQADVMTERRAAK